MHVLEMYNLNDRQDKAIRLDIIMHVQTIYTNRVPKQILVESGTNLTESRNMARLKKIRWSEQEVRNGL